MKLIFIFLLYSTILQATDQNSYLTLKINNVLVEINESKLSNQIQVNHFLKEHPICNLYVSNISFKDSKKIISLESFKEVILKSSFAGLRTPRDENSRCLSPLKILEFKMFDSKLFILPESQKSIYIIDLKKKNTITSFNLPDKYTKIIQNFHLYQNEKIWLLTKDISNRFCFEQWDLKNLRITNTWCGEDFNFSNYEIYFFQGQTIAITKTSKSNFKIYDIEKNILISDIANEFRLKLKNTSLRVINNAL